MLNKLIRFLASYGLACVLLFLLLILTLFGTLEQVEHGLYGAQKKYFESWFVVHELSSWFFIPMPGAAPVMILLFFNLLLGGIIRAPKNWKQPGMLIAHGGILLLLLSGFVTYELSSSGHTTLYEGESADYYQSYYDYVITITEVDAEHPRTWEIPGEDFQYLALEQSRTFHAKDLPFTLMIEGYSPNSTPTIVPPGVGWGVDNINVDPLPLDKEAERNIAGCIATVIEQPAGGLPEGVDPAKAALTSGGEAHVGLLWGQAVAPWVVTVQGKKYAIDLRHQRFQVPFRITLDKFIHEKHPGTTMASNYESRVTVTEEGSRRQVEIKMNEPLRYKGYTFFQASFIEQPGNPRVASVFAVVKNPADQWPKYACYIIGVGMLIHFVQRLSKYLRKENRRRANA